MIHVELLHSLALLITLAAFSGFFRQFWRSGYAAILSQGVLFGLAALASMMDPMQFIPGVQFDGRSVALSLCGALFGPLPAAIAAAMAGALRIWIGGDGAPTGLLVIAMSAGAGTLLHCYGRRLLTDHPILTLGALGLLVHVMMLVLMFTLPGALAWRVLPQLAPSVLLFFPFATVLVGLIVLDQRARHGQMEQLTETEDRFRLFLRHTPAGIAMFDRDMRYLAVSDRWYSNNGLSEQDVIGRRHFEVFPETTEEWKAIFERCLAGTTENREEDLFPRPDGSVDWVRWAIIPWQRARGDVGGLFMFTEVITKRKKAEAQLREREKRYRSVFDQHFQYTALLSLEGRVVEINDLALKVGDLQRGDVLGCLFWDIAWWDELPAVQAQWRERIRAAEAGGEPDSQMVEYRDSDGSIRFAETVVSAVFSDEGDPEYFIIQGTDVTESHRTQEEMEAARRLLESTFESMSDVVLVVDVASRVVVRCNSAVHRVLGYEVDELTGKGTRSLYEDAETYTRIGQESRQSLDQGRTFRTEVTMVKKDGTVIPVEIAVSAIHPDLNWRTGVVSVIRDITERMQAASEVQHLSRRLQDFLDFSPLAITELDFDGRYLNMNQAAAALMNGTPEKLVGKNFNDFLPPALVKQFRDRLTTVARTRAPLTVEDTLPLPEPRQFSTTLFPLMNEAGEIISVGGIALDITEQRAADAERHRLENQLRQAQKLESVGRLAGGVAHDFNNMLGVILGHTEMALDSTRSDEPLRHSLEEIQQAASRSADLTRQLLAFARRQTIAPKPLDLNETIEKMLRMLGRLVGEDVEIIWRPQQDLPAILADPSQIDQILANLTVNARDAIDGNGSMHIETGTATFDEDHCKRNPGHKPGAFVMLSVSDDGCGMDEETLAQIFEPFFTTKPLGSGTGLGLATVYGIVEQNSGFLTVDSAPGKGTTFKLYLPLHQSVKTPARSEVEHGGEPTGSETILLVEDESALLNLTQRMLERMGYTVLAMLSPQEAIAAASTYNGQIHVLITDIIMPEMNGKELKDQIEQLRPGIGTLFISGYTDDVIARHGPMDTGVHFLQKPFKATQLAKTVRETITAAKTG